LVVEIWWTARGSNSRPPRCEREPGEEGSRRRIRRFRRDAGALLTCADPRKYAGFCRVLHCKLAQKAAQSSGGECVLEALERAIYDRCRPDSRDWPPPSAAFGDSYHALAESIIGSSRPRRFNAMAHGGKAVCRRTAENRASRSVRTKGSPQVGFVRPIAEAMQRSVRFSHLVVDHSGPDNWGRLIVVSVGSRSFLDASPG
jgi:hypothetical protein